jgi:hypothetical protein
MIDNYVLFVRASTKNVSEPKQTEIHHEVQGWERAYHTLYVLYGACHSDPFQRYFSYYLLCTFCT